MRAKNASDIDISDSASIFRGTRSAIHSFEKALAGRVLSGAVEIRIALDEAEIILVDPGRRDLGIGQDLLERLGLRKLRLLVRP